ncbi:MAG: tripartite tricarboxylate transporter substrate binding protein [Rhodovarius sp.]|nr:tripartite tricarboxylate transporter substrate binding protein [Rhodovarius sp.]MDW8313993.1 tripartite tricarboxylate transporter substrate binding protein [Rhodovarius sp.]
MPPALFPPLPRRLFLATPALIAGGAAAQSAWPDRPVRVIVPFPPGGGTDVIARIIAQHLQASFGQPFTVENRSGGSGILGTEAVARAAPDGYTLGMTASGPLSVLPQLMQVPYDPVGGLTHIAIPSYTPLLLVVPVHSPARNLADLLARLRREPGRVNACNIGVGSPSHLAAEMFARAFDVSFEQIPHRGSAPALTDTVAGTCDFLFDSTASSSPLVRQGQLRALAVTAPQRLPALPEIPTVAEQGAPGFAASTWSGLVGPAGLPPAITRRINQEVRALIATPAQQQRIRDQGGVPLDLTPEGFTDFLRQEIETWGRVIRAGNIRLT